MVRLGVWLVFWLVLTNGFAQPASGRFPGSLWGTAQTEAWHSPLLQQAAAEDSVDALLGYPLRFGYPIKPVGALKWQLEAPLRTGHALRSSSIRIPGALAIGLNFSEFTLAEGARFWVSNGKNFQGEFFRSHANPEGGMATFPLSGDSICLFLEEPHADLGKSRLLLSEAVYVYRYWDVEKNGFGSSGNCNIDLACPEAAGWEDQGRAVALLLTAANTRFCSGTLLRTTGQDSEPLLLTARHCQVTANTQFMFRYASPSCNGPDGQTNRVIQGCQVLASRPETDFSLLRLSGIPAPDWGVFRAGWDRSDVAPDSSVGLHHPQGDVLKFSKDRHPPTKTAYLSQSGNPDYWRIGQWELGTTQGGSSGSALFTPQGKVIGQLRGGFASCSNLAADYYGRLAPSWDGPLANQRLRDWLDPVSSEQQQVEGAEFTAPAFQRDVALTGWENASTSYCTRPTLTLRFRNHGAEPVLQLGLSIFVNNQLVAEPDSQMLVFFYQEERWPLERFLPKETGDYTVTAIVRTVNGTVDEFAENDTLRFTYSVKPYRPYTFVLKTDNFPWETAWEIRNQSDEVVQSDPLPDLVSDTIVYPVCLPDGCYTFRITDSEGDGICCEFGEGSFMLQNEYGVPVFSGAKFADVWEQRFCIPTPDSSETRLDLFPNPNSGDFQVFVPEHLTESEAWLGIYDLNGRELKRVVMQSGGWLRVQMPETHQGVFTIRVWNNSGACRFSKFVTFN